MAANSDRDLTGAAVLEAAGVCKQFGDVTVLDNVDLTLGRGEVLALVGENGAGKSTLMRILGGVHQPTSGVLGIDGEVVHLASPLAARKRGIALIHQEPLLFPHLSIAENIFLGGADAHRSRWISWRSIRAEARAALALMGLAFDVDRPMAGLSPADQQMVEIACVLAADGRIIIMDEPTAALTPAETDRLLAIVARLRAEGRSIVFISHRLGEVLKIADRIMVLRDGRLIAARPRQSFAGEDEIVRLMIGRDIDRNAITSGAPTGRALLEVEALGRAGRFKGVSFALRCGEVVGLGGLVGAGRTEVAEAIFGIAAADTGVIRKDGNAVSIRKPRDAIRRGIAMVPEDRAQNGIFPALSVAQNITAADLARIGRNGFVARAAEEYLVGEKLAALQIRSGSNQAIATLSGGNQQKVILARWLLREPEILILDEPTRGVDVGMKAEIHRLVRALASQGKAILLISSDMTELIALSDRVLVMREGEISAEFARKDLSEDKIMAAGIPPGKAAA